MSSPRELRRRIKSISSTAQITKAMQMVAASKMRKAQQAALSMRPFARSLYRIQRKATSRPVPFVHPLLEVREVRKRAVILVGSDKGLCGALNTNVFRLASKFDPETTVFITAGRKAAQLRRAHAPAARRGLSLRRHAALQRGAGHRGRRPRPLPDGPGGRGADRRLAIRQHPDAGRGGHRVPARRRHHQPADSRRAGRRGAGGRHDRSPVRAQCRRTS